MFKAYWKSAGDADTVIMTFRADPLIRIELDTVEVDDVLANLGEMRSLMQPEHPTDLDGTQPGSTVFNPRWIFEHKPVLPHSVLHIRDPRYGWLHYAIPRDIGETLAAELLTHRSGLSSEH